MRSRACGHCSHEFEFRLLQSSILISWRVKKKGFLFLSFSLTRNQFMNIVILVFFPCIFRKLMVRQVNRRSTVSVRCHCLPSTRKRFGANWRSPGLLCLSALIYKLYFHDFCLAPESGFHLRGCIMTQVSQNPQKILDSSFSTKVGAEDKTSARTIAPYSSFSTEAGAEDKHLHDPLHLAPS